MFAFVDEHRGAWRMLYPGGQPGAIGAGASRAQTGMASLLEGLFGATARRAAIPPELAALRLMNLFWLGLGDLLDGHLWLPDR